MTSDYNVTSYQVIAVLFRFYIQIHEYLMFLLEMNWSNVMFCKLSLKVFNTAKKTCSFFSLKSYTCVT